MCSRKWLLAFLVSCHSDPVIRRAGDPLPESGKSTDSGSVVESSEPIYDWLPGTMWDCTFSSAVNGELYQVGHTWSFTLDHFTTDLPEKLSAAARTGTIPRLISQDLQHWLTSYPESQPYYVAHDQPWWGFGDNTILAQFCWAEGDDYCISIVHTLHRSGADRMVIDSGVSGFPISTISCTLAGRVE